MNKSGQLGRRAFLGSLVVTGISACQAGQPSSKGGSNTESATRAASTDQSASSDASPTTATTSPTKASTNPPVAATTAPPAPAPAFDPSIPYWEQGPFAAVDSEVDATNLVVRGELPASLNGFYVRNGPNPVSGTSPHWFFGDGMLHGVSLADGKATSYRNRWVRTAPFNAGTDLMDPSLPIGAPGGEVGQANVSVFHHAGRLLASGEVGWLYEVTPGDLATVGTYNFNPRRDAQAQLGPNVTAHPKIDPRTGYLHFFGHSSFDPFLQYYVADPDGVLVHQRVIARNQPTMIHDFAITDRDVVFWDFPAVFSIDAFVAGGFPYQWTPELGSQVGYMPLWTPEAGADDATQPTWIDIDNGFVFHGTNAWREGDNIIVDVSFMRQLFATATSFERSQLHRWTIDTAAQTWRQEQLDELDFDLPTIDPRQLGTGHNRAYYVNATLNKAAGAASDDIQFLGVAARDRASGTLDLWRPGPARQPTEPLFVPDDANNPNNTDGWLLSYVWNQADNTSTLVVLNSTDVAAGPVAEIDLPQRVPFGFHGTWVPAG